MVTTLVVLVVIGILSYYCGLGAEKIKLPSLIGMMVFGMIIGPAFLNVVPEATLKLAPALKDMALVTVLFIGGLGISVSQMKQIGKPAILLSTIPAILEGFTVAFLSMMLLDFSFIQGAILGFIIAAVSPAVLIPSMVSLIEKRIGQDKAIPQMLLVGASADDTIVITLFTTFLGIYMQSSMGETISVAMQLLLIPGSIIFSVLIGFMVFVLSKNIINITTNNYLKVIIPFFICLVMRYVEQSFGAILFNSLVSVIVYGFFIRNNIQESSKVIVNKMSSVWKVGKLYLFSFVGMAINPALVGDYFLIGVVILIGSLTVRSIGVLLALRSTNLNKKERLFCVIAYLPKATIQSAKASIPMQMGVVGGEIMQSIAILSVLITAPIGAIGINMTASKFLSTIDENND